MIMENISYYNIGLQEPNDISIKITLWQVQPPKGNSGLDSSTVIDTRRLVSVIKWQEKIDSPKEIHNRPGRSLSNHDKFNSSDPFWRVGEFGGDDTNRKIHAFSEDNPIYTYVDGDYYISTGASSGNHYTSSQGGSSNLTDAIRNLPAHNLHSNATLKPSAAILHDRLSREEPCKFMSILVAVDFDRSQMDSTTGADKLQGSYHEELLCSLKWSPSDLLEVSPGFSRENRDYYDGDSEIFVSPENMEARRRNEGNLTSFSFTSPKGALYQYTLELSNIIDNWDDIEKLELRRVDDEFKTLAEKREKLTLIANDYYAHVDRQQRPRAQSFIHVEIMSATNFYPRFADQGAFTNTPIFVTYQIVSRGNAWTKDPVGIEDEYITSEEENEERASGIVIQGQTQASKSMAVSLKVSSDVFSLYFSLILFMTSWTYLGIRRGALLTIFMVALYDAVDDPCHQVEEMDDHVYHFGHSVTIYRAGNNAKDASLTESMDTAPTIIVQVYAKQSQSTMSLLGCGSLKLTTSQSNYEVNISTCRPISYEGKSKLFLQLRDYYLGSTSREIQTEKILTPNTKRNTVTEASGTIRLRVQNMTSALFSPSPEIFNEVQAPIIRESVEEVLSRLRRNKRERAISEALDSTNLDKLKISQKTREVIERAKARKGGRIS